jgi:hypothetical protein
LGAYAEQGCQMVNLQTEDTKLGMYIFEGLGTESFEVIFGHLVFLEPFGVICSHLEYFVVIWNTGSHFGLLYVL